ncbi:MAG TPA: transglutaminase-like domain-containing protein, partial [Spirochaetota bacterium]
YEFVRDEIPHSADIGESRVTKSASEVLSEKHGICLAKSILLVAMLRAVHIPAGFGYQKLILDDEKYPWLVLHGYVFIFIDEINKWIKVDPRGNKPGIDAQFSLDEPIMAFEVRPEHQEADQNINHPYPIQVVVDCLMNNDTREKLYENLPGDFS